MDADQYAWALTAVDLGGDRSRAEQWFEAMDASATDEETGERRDWDAFREALMVKGENAGVPADDTQQFLEAMQSYVSDPLNDLVHPMLEYKSDLPDSYLEYLAQAEAAAAGAEEATDYDPEAEWYWDEANGYWQHFEDGEWKPQRTWNGEAWYVLNADRTEWVAEEPVEVAAEEPEEEVEETAAAEQESPAVEEPAAEAPEAVETPTAEVTETEEDEEPLDLEALFAEEEGEPDGDAIADDLLDSLVTELAAEFEGFDDLTEEEFAAALNAVLDSELSETEGVS